MGWCVEELQITNALIVKDRGEAGEANTKAGEEGWKGPRQQNYMVKGYARANRGRAEDQVFRELSVHPEDPIGLRRLTFRAGFTGFNGSRARGRH